MSRRWRLRLAAAVCFGTAAVLLSIMFAGDAHAAGKPVPRAVTGAGFIDGWVWDRGCTVTYSNQAPSYGQALREGLWALEASTGMTFVPVDGPADLTFTEAPVQKIGAGTVLAFYDMAGGVHLSERAGSWLPYLNQSRSRQVVTHEAAHFLGLSHNDDPWSLMNTGDARLKDGLSWDDVYRLSLIGEWNGCREAVS